MSAAICFAPFEKELRMPFVYGSQSLLTRRGFLLRKQLGEGFHYAEASPLPGHSRDSYEQVAMALEGNRKPSPPSLQFALECLARAERPFSHPVRSNALLPAAPPEQMLAQLRAFAEIGYTHCKIKISAATFSAVPGLMEKFPRMRFRLDANRSLNPASLRELLGLLGKSNLLGQVDYIEEPFEGIWNDPSFVDTPLSFAADESAPDLSSVRNLLSARNPPSVFVLKPAIQGGLQATADLLEELRSRKLRGIVTSSLEAEPGRRALLAFLSENSGEVAGLCTGFLFKENFLADRPIWNSLPGPEKAEQEWLSKLPWKDSAC